jgi:hypothetical protein
MYCGAKTSHPSYSWNHADNWPGQETRPGAISFKHFGRDWRLIPGCVGCVLYTRVSSRGCVLYKRQCYTTGRTVLLKTTQWWQTTKVPSMPRQCAASEIPQQNIRAWKEVRTHLHRWGANPEHFSRHVRHGRPSSTSSTKTPWKQVDTQ